MHVLFGSGLPEDSRSSGIACLSHSLGAGRAVKVNPM